MAHFAELDVNNIVTRVLVVNNEVIGNAEGTTGEALGIAFLKSLYGSQTNWSQTSYNENFRGVYASPGMYYNSKKDVFEAYIPTNTTNTNAPIDPDAGTPMPPGVPTLNGEIPPSA